MAYKLNFLHFEWGKPKIWKPQIIIIIIKKHYLHEVLAATTNMESTATLFTLWMLQLVNEGLNCIQAL
jgi:hypothetical protein